MLKWKRPPWALSPAEAGVQSPHVSADGLMSALTRTDQTPACAGDAGERLVVMTRGQC